MPMILAACSPGAAPPMEKSIVEALRSHLTVNGEQVSAGLHWIEPPNEYRLPPLESPHCFAEQKPGRDVVEAFEARRRDVVPNLRSSWTQGVDRLAAKLVGSEPDPLQGLFVSRAGIDAQGRRALIYAEKRAPLAGFSAFFLLERRGEWQIIDTCVLLVS